MEDYERKPFEMFYGEEYGWKEDVVFQLAGNFTKQRMLICHSPSRHLQRKKAVEAQTK
jgi:hypothetical protein